MKYTVIMPLYNKAPYVRMAVEKRQPSKSPWGGAVIAAAGTEPQRNIISIIL